MEDKGSISIFQGPTVEADAVHDYLAQNGIGALVRNHMQENLGAGWVTAEADHAAEVFVAREDETSARDLMRNLYAEKPDVNRTNTQGAIIIEHKDDHASPVTKFNTDKPGFTPPPPTPPLT